MINIRKLEAELWESADLLRAGSKLTSNQYCMPVLGLIFLRYAYSRFKLVEAEILKDRPVRNGRALREGRSGFTFNVFDSQSTPSASRSPHISDHLTVITSITMSSTIRHEELALVLLRGLIEQYLLKVNPCQNPERELLDESYMTHGKMYTPNQWKDVMQLARAHSSECTVWLARLYPHVSVLQTEVWLGFASLRA